MENTLINIALSQVGVSEFVGNIDNPQILKYFDETGYNGSKLKDETAWCSAFINWCALKSGFEKTGKLTARSWMKIGEERTIPTLGDIVVFWRESPKSWKGHVGIFIRATKNWVYVLGGNQNNRVKISAYPRNRVLGYRKLQTITKN